MSSSKEFCDSSTEEYLSDDSECLDFQEIETRQRENQDLLSESSTADKESDSELQAYMDEPLTDEEWLKIIDNKKKKKTSKKKCLKLPMKRLADETSGLQPSDRYQKESYACRFLFVYCIHKPRTFQPFSPCSPLIFTHPNNSSLHDVLFLRHARYFGRAGD